MTKTRSTAFAALLLTTVIWGLSPPIIKYTLQFVTPITFLFFRFLIVSLILAIPLSIKIKKQKLNNWPSYLWLGFLATPLNLYLLFTGLAKTSSLDGSIINAISPILVVIGGVFYLKEKVNKKESLGILITLLGVALTIIQPFLEGKANHNAWGNILVFGGTAVWAVFTLLTKKSKLDPFILTASSFVVGLILFLPLYLAQPNQNLFVLPAQSLWGILYMAILGSIVAYFTFIYGVSKIEASEASMFAYLQPIFALPLAFVLLGERITLPFVLGALLIASGVFICEKR